MAKFTAGPGADADGIDFLQFDIVDLGDGEPTITDKNRYRLEVATDDYNEFLGTGFTYNGDKDLIGGTLNTIFVVDPADGNPDGAEVWRISNFSMPVATAATFLDAEDGQGFLAAAFKGNDTITGSAAADQLLGYKGNDTIDGADGSDTLIGGDGNDSLIGGLGIDSMLGGAGNDTYVVDETGDVTDETSGGGIDLVQSKATSYTLGDGIENLTLLEGAGDIDGTGNALANTLTGNSGNNALSGESGKDKLVGGTGDDTLSGGADNDTLDGGNGNDSLDGGGGDDSMAGGAGDDIYVVDSLKDKVTETLANGKGGGIDLVRSSADFVLGNNVDNLELIGDKNTKGTGNTLDNEIAGNDFDNALFGLAGDDTLEGGVGNDTLDGGKGADNLVGGSGNDTYVLDNPADVITELGGDLSDTVAATFSIDLNDAAFDEIENATLLGSAKLTATGDAGDNVLTGNTGANTLTGNDGNDTLDGGKGVDSLVGGEGDDVYYVDNAKEKISDSSGDADEVRTTVTFTLAALVGIENLTLLGSAALNGTGDGGDNTITGNDGKNKLDGGGGDDAVNGGLGNDTLTGGSGNDTLNGGEGDDLYIVDADDVVSEAADEGTDTVQSATTASIAAFANVENLTLTGTAAIGGTGNTGSNVVTGNIGDNTLDGGEGADTLVGGKGNDTYIVDDIKDVVTEAANAGSDTVLTSLDGYVLPANVENLTLTGNGNVGGSGNTLGNLLTGNDGDNVLNGLTGNDTLTGGIGNDTLNGGPGTDTYLFDPLNDVDDNVNTGDKGLDRVSLVGNDLWDWEVERDGNDLLITAYLDEADGDAGIENNSTIRIVDHYAGANIAFFTGDFGTDNNLFYGSNPDLTTVFTPGGLVGKNQGANAEVIEGTAGADSITGGGGLVDFLDGNAGDDTISSQSGVADIAFMYGGLGDDSLFGGGGSDNLRGDQGDDVLDGGAGRDRVDYRAASGAVTVDLNVQGTAQAIGADQGNDTLFNVESARGSKFNDTLIGNDGSNTLLGLDGDDSLSGGGGFDFLVGGKGNDTLEGKALSDFVEASYEDAEAGVVVNLTDEEHAGVAAHTATDGLGGIDTLINIAGVFGSEFGDQIFGADNGEFFEPMGGDDTIDGGGGFDEIDYFSSTDGVRADLTKQGTPQVISASQGSDHFTGIEGLSGSLFNDTLIGDKNGNFLWGRDGADSLFGGEGDDRLRGGPGNDTLDGWSGLDQADYFSATSGVRVDLNKQEKLQTISASEGSDFLIGIEDVRGSSFNDTLIGNGGFNTLTGLDGNDSLNGGDGFDFLLGGAGNDTLNGGPVGDFDEVSYFDSPGSVIVNLSTTKQFGVAAGTAQDGFGGTDRLINIAGVLGSSFNDTMIGGNAPEFFEGAGGDDSIAGGKNFDALEFINSIDGVSVDLTKQGTAQLISASQGKDTFTGIEDIFGSLFADTLTGDGGENFIFGRDGNDTIAGNGGTDLLSGDAGDDLILVPSTAFRAVSGGEGIDRLAVTGPGVVFTQQTVFEKFFALEEIDLTTGKNSLTLSALDVLQVSDTDTLRILGNAGDSVTSIGQGWSKGADQTIDGQLYRTYTSNLPGATVTLLVDADITQTVT